jgi:hypothetical protein
MNPITAFEPGRGAETAGEAQGRVGRRGRFFMDQALDPRARDMNGLGERIGRESQPHEELPAEHLSGMRQGELAGHALSGFDRDR